MRTKDIARVFFTIVGVALEVGIEPSVRHAAVFTDVTNISALLRRREASTGG